MSEIGSPSAAATSGGTTSSLSHTLSAPSSFAQLLGDIKSLIPIVLHLQTPNYSQWRHLFLVHLGRCSLRHHVDGTDPAHDDPVWVQDDYTILQWLYTRISFKLF